MILEKSLCKILACVMFIMTVFTSFGTTAVFADDTTSTLVISSETSYNGTSTDPKIGSTSATLGDDTVNIYVDANSGKFSVNGSWRQFNAGTKIYIPVTGVNALSFKTYSAGFEQRVYDKNKSETITSVSSSYITKTGYFEGSTLSDFGYSGTIEEDDVSKTYLCIEYDNNDYIDATVYIYTKASATTSVSGTVSGFPDGATLVFKNTETEAETTGTVDGATYSADLYTDCEYKVTAVKDDAVAATADNITFSSSSGSEIAFETADYAKLTGTAVIPDGVAVTLVPSSGDSITIENGEMSYDLVKDTDYTVTLSGDTVDEYQLTTDATINISEDTEKSITVEKKTFQTISGSISCDNSEVLAAAQITFVNGNYSYSASVSDGKYSVSVCPDKDYDIRLTGTDAYAYDILDYSQTAVENSDVTRNVTIEKVTEWDFTNSSLLRSFTSGTNMVGSSYRGLSFSGYTAKAAAGYTDIYGTYSGDTSKPTSITIPVDSDTTSVAVSYKGGSGTFTLSLGDETVSITDQTAGTIKYAVSGDESVVLKIDGENDAKAYIYSITLSSDSITYEGNETLYVGSEQKYTTLTAAINAVKTMTGRGDDDVVTISIDPGVYREKALVISEPNIKLVNSSEETPTEVVLGNADDLKNNVIITGYYGYGCVYSSLDNADPSTWGAVIKLESGAKNFSAENITFENSYNLYITDEEKTDITAESTNYAMSSADAMDRVSGSADVRSKAFTERAAAMAIYADGTSFKNCNFLSSQDTLMTGNSTSISGSFDECTIQGNTDYIFGDGVFTFNNCSLLWGGYSDGQYAGYITAAGGSANSTATYIFNSCTIGASSLLSGNYFTSGYFGRPWNTEKCHVVFANTYYSDAYGINSTGWADMSDMSAANTTGFAEYSNSVDTTGYSDLRISKVVNSLNGLVYDRSEGGGFYRSGNEILLLGGLNSINDNIEEVGFIYTTDNDTAESLRYAVITELPTADGSAIGTASTSNVYTGGAKVKFTGDEEAAVYNNSEGFSNPTVYFFADGINISNISSEYGDIYVTPYIKQDGIYYCCLYYSISKE